MGCEQAGRGGEKVPLHWRQGHLPSLVPLDRRDNLAMSHHTRFILVGTLIGLPGPRLAIVHGDDAIDSGRVQELRKLHVPCHSCDACTESTRASGSA